MGCGVAVNDVRSLRNVQRVNHHVVEFRRLQHVAQMNPLPPSRFSVITIMIRLRSWVAILQHVDAPHHRVI